MEMGPKHAWNDFYFNRQHFSLFNEFFLSPGPATDSCGLLESRKNFLPNIFPQVISGLNETAGVSVLPAPPEQPVECHRCHLPCDIHIEHSLFECFLSDHVQQRKDFTLTLVNFGSPLLELFRTLPKKTFLTYILGYIDENLTNALDVSHYPNFFYIECLTVQRIMLNLVKQSFY